MSRPISNGRWQYKLPRVIVTMRHDRIARLKYWAEEAKWSRVRNRGHMGFFGKASQ